MKKILYTFALVLLTALGVSAQVDTLLHEDFNTPFDPDPADFGEDGVAPISSGNDAVWVNFDTDGLLAANNRPQNWYQDTTGWINVDSIFGGVLMSSSWLSGYAPGNRNWLITPPLAISDSMATLSWRAAPYQGPRYMDGYTVVVSTGSNDPTLASQPFTDTLFRAASMVSIDAASGSTTDLDSFSFSPGYIHANGFTDTTNFVPADSVDAWGVTTFFNAHVGRLEYQMVDLSAYVGQTIYIAFVHDADDDNLLGLDDILVTRVIPTSSKKVALDVNLNIYPNPATNYLTIDYTMEEQGRVSAQIRDMQGKMVKGAAALSDAPGVYQKVVDVANLATGTYTITLIANGQYVTKHFIKR